MEDKTAGKSSDQEPKVSSGASKPHLSALFSGSFKSRTADVSDDDQQEESKSNFQKEMEVRRNRINSDRNRLESINRMQSIDNRPHNPPPRPKTEQSWAALVARTAKRASDTNSEDADSDDGDDDDDDG